MLGDQLRDRMAPAPFKFASLSLFGCNFFTVPGSRRTLNNSLSLQTDSLTDCQLNNSLSLSPTPGGLLIQVYLIETGGLFERGKGLI